MHRSPHAAPGTSGLPHSRTCLQPPATAISNQGWWVRQLEQRLQKLSSCPTASTCSKPEEESSLEMKIRWEVHLPETGWLEILRQ